METFTTHFTSPQSYEQCVLVSLPTNALSFFKNNLLRRHCFFLSSTTVTSEVTFLEFKCNLRRSDLPGSFIGFKTRNMPKNIPVNQIRPSTLNHTPLAAQFCRQLLHRTCVHSASTFCQDEAVGERDQVTQPGAPDWKRGQQWGEGQPATSNYCTKDNSHLPGRGQGLPPHTSSSQSSPWWFPEPCSFWFIILGSSTNISFLLST